MPTTVDDARTQILSAMSVLMQRRANTSDSAEKKTISSVLKELNRQLEVLEQADLLDAAAAIAKAADAVERAIGAAKLQPFGNFLRDAQDVLAELGQIEGEMHALESLTNADATGETIVLLSSVPARNPPPLTQLPPISNATRFVDIDSELVAWYAACQIRPERAKNVEYYLSRLLKFKSTYEAVGNELNGIPWQFVGILHAMEAGFNFSCHLHNGDPLTARTRRVPAGHPVSGSPPFTWRASALDALKLKGLHQVPSWPMERVLFELERYNGFGYRLRGLPTPYLWSFSNLYSKGKYVADHDFDPEAISKQCGAATILKGLEASGNGLAV